MSYNTLLLSYMLKGYKAYSGHITSQEMLKVSHLDPHVMVVASHQCRFGLNVWYDIQPMHATPTTEWTNILYLLEGHAACTTGLCAPNSSPPCGSCMMGSQHTSVWMYAGFWTTSQDGGSGMEVQCIDLPGLLTLIHWTFTCGAT